MNKNKIAFLVCSLTIAIYAECYTFSKFYSTDSLQKEIVTLEKEFEKCTANIGSTEFDAEKCVGNRESVSNKNETCRALKIFTSKHYNSLDTTIDIKFFLDGDCNQIRFFSITDKKNKTSKDSTAYSNGSWEVFEVKGETEISLRNSLGTNSLSIRDSEGRLQERKLIDGDGSLIIHDRYIWKDDLLVKVIGLEGTRNYYYGKNPYEDTVRVVPSDEGYGYGFNGGYDGTVGKVPKKGDKNYKDYLDDPYGPWVDFEEDYFNKEKVEQKNEEPCPE